MKALIAIVILAAVGLVGWQIYSYWTDIEKKDKGQARVEEVAKPDVTGTDLPGMVPSLESSLEASQRKGAAGLRAWLTTYGKTVKDPRLAWIELDYAVLVTSEDPVEARKVFTRVKKRTPTTSPVYSRVKQLEKTYE